MQEERDSREPVPPGAVQHHDERRRRRGRAIGYALSALGLIAPAAAYLYLPAGPSSPSERLWSVAFILSSAAIGVACVVRGLRAILSAWRSTEWPSVPGEILASYVEDDGNETPRYRATIIYRYVVAGGEYVGELVYFGARMSLPWSEWADRLVSRYQPGQTVPIRYDQSDPTRSVIEPGIHWQPCFIVLFGILVLGYSLAVWQRIVGE
jgi:hypothetical protein